MASQAPPQKLVCKAAGACVNKQGQLLLLKKRGLDVGIPPGEVVEQGETPEAALAREIAEELTCGVENKGLLGCFVDEWCEKNSKTAILAFKARLVGEPKAANEIAHARWFSAQELLEIPDVGQSAKALAGEWKEMTE